MKMKEAELENEDLQMNSMVKDIVDYSMIPGKEKEIFEYLTQTPKLRAEHKTDKQFI